MKTFAFIKFKIIHFCHLRSPHYASTEENFVL